ncbi:MAG: hypothetical protein Q7S74_02235 [Nanoarchaeota archaeon]|nr:hypothetical protein [Nanoarchaeota archaeon]
MSVEADIIVPPQVVSIQVPDQVYLGNITIGSQTETYRVQVKMNNTGNTNITITPRLVNPNNLIFQNLFFFRILEDTPVKIGDWSLPITKPASIGGVKEGSFYMKLDLADYPGTITSSMLNYKTDVEFIAVAQ